MNEIKLKTIRIPVFRTKIEEEELQLFDINKEDMVRFVCEKINNHNCSNINKIILENNGKNYTHEIVKLTAQKKNMHGSPVVFIQMSAHKTNLGDGYIETSQKIPMTKDVKIGSDHHYVIMYPMAIKGRSKFKKHWHIFIYDDPNKDSQEFIRIVKVMIKQVLNIKISNLKSKDFVEELKNFPILDNVTANFQTVELTNDQYSVTFNNYIVGGRIYSRKEFNLMKIPYDKIIEMIDDDDDITIKKKVFNIPIGKKEYKISKTIRKDYQNAKTKYSLLIESLYNESISITENEYNTKLYDEEFVIDKLESVVTNYMS